MNDENEMKTKRRGRPASDRNKRIVLRLTEDELRKISVEAAVRLIRPDDLCREIILERLGHQPVGKS